MKQLHQGKSKQGVSLSIDLHNVSNHKFKPYSTDKIKIKDVYFVLQQPRYEKEWT